MPLKTKNDVVINKKLDSVLKELALKKGVSKSSLVNELLENMGLKDEKIKPVVLQIPVELLSGNKQGLVDWLEHRSSGIVGLFYKDN